MQVNLVALRGFVVDNGLHTLDIQTTGGDVSSEEERDLAVTEVLDGFDTLETRN
jgi:hypothetical protein